jgi:predicted  nucleic acid-binding Zn-ribbon protein
VGRVREGSRVSEELSVLYKVQVADTEIARREQALATLDTGAELEREMAALRSELGQLGQAREAAENENLDRELEAKTLEEKRDRFQKQLYSGAVTNPRQLADLQNEVAMLAREIGKTDDCLLELMEEMERLRAEIAEREAKAAELEARVAETRGKHEKTSGRLREEIVELKLERKELAGHVSARLLQRYDQIRERSGGLGLVKVMDETCPGCHIGLPSETVKAMKAGREVQQCDHCARILVWGAEGE